MRTRPIARRLVVLSAAVATVAVATAGAGPALAGGVIAPTVSHGSLVPAIIKMQTGDRRAKRSGKHAQPSTPPASPSGGTTLPPPTGIGPGSHLIIDRPDGEFGCTANFVWSSGTTRYLGAAGHCFLTDKQTATAGPGANANTSKVHVSVCVSGCYFGGQTGFIVTGNLVPLGSVAYARQTQNGEDIGNDFGIVAIPASLAGQIRPSLPVWGGPTNPAAADSIGSVLCHYGYGVGAGEAFPTQARTGLGMGNDGKAWYADLAATPGDSGSAVETCGPASGGIHGAGAVGILTHLTVGTSVTAGTTVGRAIAMAKQAGITLSLVTGS